MKADIELKSIHFRDGEKEEDIINVSGEYHDKGDKSYIIYDHTSDDGDVSHNMIKFDNSHFSQTKKGTVKTVMEFEHGRKTATDYVTPFGTFLMEFDTKEYAVEKSSDSVKITLKYDLDINGARNSRCHIFLRLNIINDTM